MNILVLNAGSSSIKYQVFAMDQQQAILKGLIDRIGETGSEIPDHHAALERIALHLRTEALPIQAIGHRVVHGGDYFQQPALINAKVIEAIQAMIPLAPLHNPANLEGIRVAQSLFPDLPQVAVFDTAFHQTMPAKAYRYAIPNDLYRKHKVRRYGFHGTSHHYVAEQAAAYLEHDLHSLNLISAHLGNGCSMTAIAQGLSVDTSMGMTPLEGLVMGTRSGNIDPGLFLFLQKQLGLSAIDIDTLLNKHSGLKGLCGVSDMRQIQQLAEENHEQAQLAESLFVYHIRKYMGAYTAVLGKVDAVIFTGGIGEHSAHIREQVCHDLNVLGITLDKTRNQAKHSGIRTIHSKASRVKVLVIPTNEELAIARYTQKFINH
ncbi:MAG: acetate kinase [Proteobacteria bacterium]|nr:MAG: acetate kinase [Pseudomonadota bacterium]